MNPDSIQVLLESALRALLLAFTVWVGLYLLRVRNVLAQKAAWGLVLVLALAMPLLMRWQWLPAYAAIRLPMPVWRQTLGFSPASETAFYPAMSTAPLGPNSVTPEPVPATRQQGEMFFVEFFHLNRTLPDFIFEERYDLMNRSADIDLAGAVVITTGKGKDSAGHA